MEKKIYFLSLRKNFDSFLFAIAGFFIVLLFTKHSGIGLSPDSVVYTLSAMHLAESHSLNAANALPMTDFPAFYPFFLSVFIFITKQSPVLFGTILNGCLFALVIFFSGCIIQRFVYVSRLYKNSILLFILLSPTLIEVYYMLWSETLFIFLLLLFFIALKYYFDDHQLSRLIIVAFIVSLACVTRYAGISLLGTAGLLLLLDKELPWKKKILHIVVFSVISITLLVINLLHNYQRTGMLTGNREKGITPLIENIKYCGNVFCDWLPFFNGNYILAVTVALLVFALAVSLFAKHFFKKGYYYSYENIGACYVIVYSIFILATATLSHYETLNSRLLSPMFIPFLWSISYPFILIINKSKKWLKWTLLAGSLALSFFFVQNEISQVQDLYDDISANGIPGYNEDAWKNSPLVAFLQQHKSMFNSDIVYSNDTQAFCFFTGKYCDQLPNYLFKKEINDYGHESPHYLIWFNNSENKSLFHLADIAKYKKMKLIQSFADGQIYWCENYNSF